MNRISCCVALGFLYLTSATWGQTTLEYKGAGSCNGASCHGNTSVSATGRIWGNEYAIWATYDKHFRAAKVLTEPRGKRMAEVLGIANAMTDQRCTVCHVLGSPPASASDGVSCEGCHGPASQWLGPHVNKNSHAESVSKGMYDTKDLSIQTSVCLGCHLGDTKRQVTHDLIAAGHPDLAFELDTFAHAEPVHYKAVPPSAGNSLPRVRAWAVGQATELADGMKLLAQHANNSWPEFSDLECYQCHHDIKTESWRIQRGYQGRKPGNLQLNLARLEVARTLIAETSPGQRAPLDAAIAQLTSTINNRIFDGPAISQAARSVAREAEQLAGEYGRRDFTVANAKAIIRALNTDMNRIAGSGVQSAEQATMALDALTSAAEPDRKQSAAKELYDYLEHPSTYQPRDFAALFRRAASRAE